MFESDLSNAYDFVMSQGLASFVALFWYVIIFEIPRYGLSFVSIAMLPVASLWRRGAPKAGEFDPDLLVVEPSVSVVVIGYSEGRSLERCVRSLRAQSFSGFELVVVSDGSTDNMVEVSQRLLEAGLVDRVLASDIRCGKAAGVNLAFRAASGKIIINVDCDCSYDRFAIERILEPFADPSVGGVSGDILPRNGDKSLVAAFQTIEYLIGISLGKRAANMMGQVVCVSGAFGAFRREAFESVGGIDAGGGEDLDLTIRLRSQGWKIAFAPEALCYTDVPAKSWALVRQRLRWERDSIRVRYRKHRRIMSPLSPEFRTSEAYHQYDFLIFHVLFGFVFPLYLAYLVVHYGSSSIILLLAVQLVALLLDIVAFSIALAATGRWQYASYILYLPGYGLYSGLFMRLVRIWAYLEEWTFDASRKDSYVPVRVSDARYW